MTQTCNWFWGSHGCGLLPKHDMAHVCTPADPCSRHTEGQVTFIYTDGSGEGEPAPMQGYCIPNDYGPCGDPKHCLTHAAEAGGSHAGTV